MTDLFSEGSQADLSLFDTVQQDKSVVDTSSSDKNLIAQASIIEGGDLVETYSMLSSMGTEDRKFAINQIGKNAKEEINRDQMDLVSSLVQDPGMSEEAKMEFIQTIAGEAVKPHRSANMTAEKIHTTVSGNESEEEERRLATVSELIDPITELMLAKQKAVNSLSFDEQTGEAVSLINNPGDLAELFLPFTEQVYAKQIKDKISSGEIGTFEDFYTTVLLGESKVFTREAFESAPLEDKLKFINAAPEIFNQAKTLVFTNDNDLLQLDSFMSATVNGYYGDVDRYIDDAVSLLDLAGLGPLVKPLTKATRLNKLAQYAKAKRRRTASKKQPASVQSLAEQTNPEVARSFANAIDKDVTGEAAEALTGTSRTEAQVDMHGPQIPVEDGSVLSKPYAMDRDIMAAAYEESGRIYRTPNEIRRTSEVLRTDRENLTGLVMNEQHTTSPIIKDNGTLDISEAYQTPAGGWVDPKQAIKDTVEALSYYGVKEEDLVLMRKSGDEYVPTTTKEVLGLRSISEAEGGRILDFNKNPIVDDYIVKANFNYSPKAIDVVRDDLEVRLNFLDSLSSQAPTPGKATASRYVFQSSHMLDEAVMQGSVAAVDQGNRLQKVIMDKAKKGVYEPLENLPDANARRISKIISDQNLARKNYTKDELAGLGVTEEAELKILDNWKYLNDQHWHLTNRDMAITLRNKNYSMYTDTVNGDMFVGKPVASNQALPKHVYDPVDGKTKLTRNLEPELGRTDGHIFELRHPEVIDGVEVRNILVRGGDADRYFKAIQENDILLPYVEGHSHIRYKDNFFIERELVDENGNVIGKPQAIQTAPESTSAQAAIARLEANASNALKGRKWRYSARNDRELTPVEISERHFDVSSMAGLSSQRKRGQTLRSYDSARVTDMAPNITDPLESFKQSTAELARRVPMREYLDDFEDRILKQHGDILPKDDYGRPRLPTKGEKLKGGDTLGTKGSKKLADARTAIEHYNYMKFGYHNTLDAGWRTAINKTSQAVGVATRKLAKTFPDRPGIVKAGTKAEKTVAAIAEEVPSPLGALRGTAFNAHIAMSAPPSQWMVQGLPAFINGLLHPNYVFSGDVVRDWRKLVLGLVHEGNPEHLRKTMGKAKADEILKLKAEWDRTGLGVGIDKHLIVESGVEQLIETERFKGLKDLHEGVFGKLREIGFDKGEMFNLGTFWLAARNDAIQQGKSLDNARTFDEVRAKTRALTMNMNKAGEMPWNKDSLSLFTQFMISPYKAMTMYLDRGLTAEDKWKIAAWQGLMMPLPIYLTYHLRAAVGVEGTEGDLATEVITNGILGGMFNSTMNYMFEDAGSASWQRNVQFDPTFAGPLTFVQTLSEDVQGASLIQAIAQQAPSLAMFDGYNPIATNLIKSVGGLIAAPFRSEEDRLLALNAFAGENGALWQYSALGRGLSAAYKELLTDSYGKRYSAVSGKEQDPSVSTPETFAKALFGLETTYQTVVRQANFELYDGSKEAYNDADLLLDELRREATQLGFNMDDPKRVEYMLRNYAEAFPNGRIPPKTASYIMRQLSNERNRPLTEKLMKGYGLSLEEVETAQKALGNASPELQKTYDFFQSEENVKALRGEE